MLWRPFLLFLMGGFATLKKTLQTVNKASKIRNNIFFTLLLQRAVHQVSDYLQVVLKHNWIFLVLVRLCSIWDGLEPIRYGVATYEPSSCDIDWALLASRVLAVKQASAKDAAKFEAPWQPSVVRLHSLASPDFMAQPFWSMRAARRSQAPWH